MISVRTAEEANEVLHRTLGIPGPENPYPASVWVQLWDTPVGQLLAAATDTHWVFLDYRNRARLSEQLRRAQTFLRGRWQGGASGVLASARQELEAYFAGSRARFDVPIHLPGSPFEERVWELLQAIGPGETVSYRDLAQACGDPGAVRAVGRANGANRMAIRVPCHRVVESGGGLGGYSGGLEAKQWLLDHELTHYRPNSTNRQAKLW